jgi:hypothetical protein
MEAFIDDLEVTFEDLDGIWKLEMTEKMDANRIRLFIFELQLMSLLVCF